MDLFSESKKWKKNILKIFLITYSLAPLLLSIAILITCPFTAQPAE